MNLGTRGKHETKLEIYGISEGSKIIFLRRVFSKYKNRVSCEVFAPLIIVLEL